MNTLSDFGEKHGVEWLTYNPLRMRFYHRYAKRDAPAVIAAFEAVVPEARRYADIGAGSGAYAAEAVRRGHPTMACEHSAAGRLIARRQGVRSVGFDLTKSAPASLGQRDVDLTYCLEVAEHLPPSLGDALVDFMATLRAPTIVFSAAQPGQGGTGHIDEQPPEYWAERFEGRGYGLSRRQTEALRASLRTRGVSGEWLTRNVLVLRRR